MGKKNIEDMENLVSELMDKGEYLDNKNWLIHFVTLINTVK